MYDEHYTNALNPQPGDLKTNLLAELRSYLKLSAGDQELYDTCKQASEAILDEWRKQKIDPRDKEAVTKFYVDTQLYCYELLTLEIDAPKYRQDQLKSFADFLKRNQKLKGCDYGSGIGTLGLYLNRNGIHCDFADVSERNLAFIARRLETREVRGPRLINLLREEVPSGEYDFITAFDVIEHVTDPVQLVQSISSKLRAGGYFIFNLLYDNQDGTPHLLRDPNLIRKNIRGFGLRKVTAFGEFKVYQKVTRPAAINSLIRLADSLFWDGREKLRSIKAAQ